MNEYEDSREQIEECLNCKRPSCSGNYPQCKGIAWKKDENRGDLSFLGRGNPTRLICWLVKLGHDRRKICEICGVSSSYVCSCLRHGVRTGIITQKEANDSRVNHFMK